MSTFDDLRQLVSGFYRDVEVAKRLETGNPDDELAIRIAIVGFSRISPADRWERLHWEFVTARLRRDFDDEELSVYGENGANLRFFSALCLGYLLGLYQQGRLDD